MWLGILLLGCGPVAQAPSPGVEKGVSVLQVPPGFVVTMVASGLPGPRTVAYSPSGDLYVALSKVGEVWVYPNGSFDRHAVFARRLERPFGLAFHEGWTYIAEETRVIRVRDDDGDSRADADSTESVVTDLPAGGHWTRTLLGAEDGFFLAVGSSCNLCEESNKWRAVVHWCTWEGNCRLYAKGARNFVGLATRPDTTEVWATENGRDWQGDDFPPDELNLVIDGGDYGWPYCSGKALPDPDYSDAARCRETMPSAFDFPAHSAPLGLAFYDGTHFPDEYRGDAFVAFHGSWNRAEKTGYKVVRVHFEEGRPAAVSDFLWGFLKDGKVSGRPVWVTAAPDGSLLVSDDEAGRLFRVEYLG